MTNSVHTPRPRARGKREGKAPWHLVGSVLIAALHCGCGDDAPRAAVVQERPAASPAPDETPDPNATEPMGSVVPDEPEPAAEPTPDSVPPSELEQPAPPPAEENAPDATDAEVPAEPSAPELASPCPTDGTPCRIMPLGDSITFGIGSSGGGYRVPLFREALANGRTITFVGTAPPNGPPDVDGQPFPQSHQGHSGFAISSGGFGSLASVVDDAIAASDPHIILLMIGTNDMNGNIDVANAPSRLGALLDQIAAAAPAALLAVAQIVPTTNANTNVRVEAYNAAIPELVRQRVEAGRQMLVVDMYEPFVSDPNFATTLMADFLHPNDMGYVVIARTWFDAIEPFLAP